MVLFDVFLWKSFVVLWSPISYKTDRLGLVLYQNVLVIDPSILALSRLDLEELSHDLEEFW